MVTEQKISEKFLYEIWKNQKFEKSIATADGEIIEVIYSGEENIDKSGPDFINSRIKIGNITYVGDIEIDTYYSDWKAHGHNLNKRFNKVILHATLENDSDHYFVYTQNGRKVHTVPFASFLEKNLRESIGEVITKRNHKRTNKISCMQLTNLADDEEKINFLYELGMLRFKKKCEKLLYRLKELVYIDSLKIKEPMIRYDIPQEFLEKKLLVSDINKYEMWEQLLYENIFEALGYSQNKNIMSKLAQNVDVKFLKSTISKNDILSIEATYFHISGLLPDIDSIKDEKTSEYLRTLYDRWLKIKDKYDNKIFHENDWHFFKLRPQNFPTIRIAGGAKIAHQIIFGNLIPILFKKIKEIHNLDVLTNSVRNLFIIKSDGYWFDHFVFDKKTDDKINYLVGKNRADEIFINVILPYAYVYFNSFGKKDLAEKIIKIYTNSNLSTENSLVNEISSSLNLKEINRKSVIYQGMIELFRTYCSKGQCLNCKIGSVVFN